MLQKLSQDQLPGVLAANEQVLVEFGASWCSPCRAMEPKLAELASELEGQVAIVKIDLDESPELAMQYQIMSAPTLIMFQSGKAVAMSVGGKQKQEILDLVLQPAA